MFKRSAPKPTSWLLPLALLALAFVSGAAGVSVSLLGGWS